MCGINGFNWKNAELIALMNKAIKHRGPDDEGIFIDDNVTFGHVRLSIIELTEKGHQPMGLDAKGNLLYRDEDLHRSIYTIIFNGEIYNFQEIAEKLGEQTDSGSDTEIILRAYKKWGANCVEHFNGMWSFCIFDKKKQLLFCSRDRLGVKPFYYYYGKKEGEFAFSSEMKGIIQAKKQSTKTINKDAVKLYFSLGYIPAPLTIYSEINKLDAGHNIMFNLQTKKLTLEKYYELPDFKPVNDRKKLIEDGKQILQDATRLRMISDVPVGAFLSGGLDSSAVVGAMSKNTQLRNLHTFSIGFEQKYDKGRYDETEYINKVRKYYNTKHHHYYFKEKDFEQIVSLYPFMYDEPFADYSGFPTFKVSEMAQKHVTVVLSGDGGDEIFGGYAMHKLGAGMDLICKNPKFVRKLFSKIPVKKNLNGTQSLYLLKEAMKLSLKEKNRFYSDSLPGETYKPEIYKKWTQDTLQYCLRKGGNNLSEALRIHDLLYNTLQNNFLVKVDRASMQAPIEVRSPFLDYRFAEFAQKIPPKWKATPAKTKILMREIIDDLVPPEILYRGKQGFEPPLDKWILNKKYLPILQEGLETIRNIDAELYDFYQDKVFAENNKLYTIYKIKLFIFQLWWNKWINSNLDKPKNKGRIPHK